MIGKLKTKQRLENIETDLKALYEKACEMNKTATLLNNYCKAYLETSEEIYNLSSITKILEQTSNDITCDLNEIINKSNEDSLIY